VTDTTFDLETLSALAAKVDKRLRWAAFLLGAMLLILVIDLQIKRSLGRQAVEQARSIAITQSLNAAAERLRADLTGGSLGREPGGPADGSRPDAGGDRPDVLGGTPPVAEASTDPGGPLEDAVARHPASARKRAPRNGPRAGRGTGE
jgi:hypothetical protein